jgi:Protein of unknown function (DUF3761)
MARVKPIWERFYMRSKLWTSFAASAVVLSLVAGSAAAYAQDHQDDQRPSERHDEQHPAPRPDDQRGDPADRYRHAHPNASARCHDGFFTTTKDRNRACTKHGGIDVWLVP